MSFQTSKAFEHIDKLAYEIGPRLSGSRGEEMAATYIKQVMNSCGLRVNVQEFEFVERGLKRRVYSLLMAAALISAFFIPPLWALLIWAIAFSGHWYLPLVLPKKRSRNIIGIVGSAGSGETKVVTAHYDSARCKISKGEIISVGLYPLLILFTLVIILRFFIPNVWNVFGVISATPLVFVLGLMYASGSIKKVSPGANDNAAGVAVVLEVARAMSETPPQDTRIIFIATGAEEQGLKGAERLSTNGAVPKNTRILNLDGVGFGTQPYFIKGNGLLKRVKTSLTLNQKISEVGQKLNLNVRPWWAVRARHDHVPFVKRGYSATTITFDSPEENPDKLGKAFGLNNARKRVYKWMHTMNDLPDKLRPKTVETAGAFLLELLKSQW